MYKQGYKLSSPVDFDNAMFFGSQVMVMKDGRMIDQGAILSHQDRIVKFNHNTMYDKERCEFLIVFTPPDYPRK